AASNTDGDTLKVPKVSADTAAHAFGTTVSSTIAHAGQRDFYTFTLTEAKQLYFDSLTNNTTLTWALSGPRGPVVLPRAFATSDSTDNVATATATLDLVPGDYVLTVVAQDDQTPTYSFRLFDLTQASRLTFNTGGTAVVTSQLSPTNETDLYSFSATAGERFYFDFVSLSTNALVTWRLLDPFGGTVFGPTDLTGDAG